MKNLLRIFLIVVLLTIAGYSTADTSSSNIGPSTFYRNNLNGSRTLLGHIPMAVGSSIKKTHINTNQILDLRVTLPLKK